jgi:succinate-semialdehyde dehydrogenase / glutarate-semialdehyde dehydrogenase
VKISSINPATGDTLRTYDEHSDGEIEERIARAAATFTRWRVSAVAERAAILRRAAELLEERKDAYGRLMTLEMGKPLRAGVEEAVKCAWGCRYYADHAAAFTSPETILSETNGRAEVHYLPLGVVLAIMPWNFPFWQVVRFAAPAIAAGNVGLLKHASNVPQCALALEALFADAGAPSGVFQTLLVGSRRVDRVLADPRIAAVTLTGSTPAGSKVAETAGRLIKPSVLELGGSDPFIVMTSADIAEAAKTAVTARTINNGQSCIAAKRFIVAESVADEFERRFVDGMRALTVGDPLDPATQIGPLATADIAEDLERQVNETISLGARVLLGGHRLAGPGNFFEPTVLTDIPRESPAYHDELFGPVASLFRVSGIEEAIRLANDTPFGLAASVWTTDASEAPCFIRDIEAGQVFINAMVASDPRLPFGGVKRSGYGRELGVFGLREFVNTKTVRWAGVSAGARTE